MKYFKTISLTCLLFLILQNIDAQSRHYVPRFQYQPYSYEELAAPVISATNFANQKVQEYLVLLDRAYEELLGKDNPRLSLYYAQRALGYVMTYDFISKDQLYQIFFLMGMGYQALEDYKNARQYYWWAYNDGKGGQEGKQAYDNLTK